MLRIEEYVATKQNMKDFAESFRETALYVEEVSEHIPWNVG